MYSMLHTTRKALESMGTANGPSVYSLSLKRDK